MKVETVVHKTIKQIIEADINQMFTMECDILVTLVLRVLTLNDKLLSSVLVDTFLASMILQTPLNTTGLTQKTIT